MIRSAIFWLFFTPPILADDLVDKELKAAKKEYEAKITFVRQQAIDDLKDKIIELQKMGVVPNFMIKELDGFKEKDIVPILPPLVSISKKYLEDKKKADEALEAALTKAREAYLKSGKPDYDLLLKAELKRTKMILGELTKQIEEFQKREAKKP